VPSGPTGCLRPYPPDFRLFLASRSPRRRDLLDAARVPYQVVASLAEEADEGPDPYVLARDNARAKARRAVLPSGISAPYFVLGTDTEVVSEGRALGKPAGREEAEAMLLSLAGREHEVVSGVALRFVDAHGREHEAVDQAVTRVSFCRLGPADLAAYLDTGEWHDKAGGYAVQGVAALFVEGIRGDYTNVVGLPLRLLATLFRGLGFDLLRREWREQV
jgi:septum formation protein